MYLPRLSLFLIFAAVGCGDRTPPTPAAQSVRPARIFTVADTTETLRYSFVGRVEALQTIDVSFEVPGVLVALPILEGQEIAKGGLLAALDTTDSELAVREAEVQVKLAQQDLDRKRRVLKQKGIARSTVDDARSVYELQAIRLGQAKERLSKSRIYAPFDATIARRYVENFFNIRANTNIARLHDLSQMLVVAHVPEALLATLSPEQLLELYAEFDFAPGEKFELGLHENRGEADSVAQTYEVSLIMQRPSNWNVLPGMTASVHARFLDLNHLSRTTIPASALVSHPDKSFYVWVYDAQSQGVSQRAVKIGVPTQNGIVVLKGLTSGEQIVATGADFLQAGMKVRPLEAN